MALQDHFGLLKGKKQESTIPIRSAWHPPFFRPTVGPGIGPGSGGSALRLIQRPIGPFLRPT